QSSNGSMQTPGGSGVSFSSLIGVGGGISGHVPIWKVSLICTRRVHKLWVTRPVEETFMGRRSGRIIRTTISIPQDLMARMQEAKGVNWSAVAARAFEEQLNEIARARKEKTMDDAILRLRAAKRCLDDEDYREGHKAGQAWACEHAEPKELE